MKRMVYRLGWLLCIGCLSVFSQGQDLGAGVVIENLDEDAALFQAGARVGDRFTRWELLPNEANPRFVEGSIVDYFYWWDLETNQAPRGNLKLFGKRGGKPLEVEVSIDSWCVNVRPVLKKKDLATYRKGKKRIELGKIRSGIKAWETLAHGDSAGWIMFLIGNVFQDEQEHDLAEAVYRKGIRSAEDYRQKAAFFRANGNLLEKLELWELALEAYADAENCWMETRTDGLVKGFFLKMKGNIALRRGNLVEAERLFQQALLILEKKANRSLSLAKTFINLGVVALEQGDLLKAEERLQKALVIQKQKTPKSLDFAKAIHNLGLVAYRRGDLAKAEMYFIQSLIIKKEKKPNSLDLTGTYRGLGAVAYKGGDLVKAEKRFKQALAIIENKAPNSLKLAGTISNLGALALTKGDLQEGERLFQQALVIQKKKASNSLKLASTLGNLGVIALSRGSLEEAEEHFKQAKAIEEQKAPNSLSLAKIINNLGNLALSRGNLETADQYFRKALQIKKFKAPNSLSLALTFRNLGSVAWKRGNLAEAERRFHQAETIRELKAPASLSFAGTLGDLGLVAIEKGDLNKAERYLLQALTIQEKSASNSLAMAGTLGNLGAIAWTCGELAIAERRLNQSLSIQNKKAPNSLGVALTHNTLGLVAMDRGDLAVAEECFFPALAIQRQKIPNSLSLAGTLGNLGIMARHQGDLEAAERWLQEALIIQEQKAPDSLDLAGTIQNLGIIAWLRGNMVEAEKRFERTLVIKEKKASGSLSLAGTLNNLGVVAESQGDLVKAEGIFLKSLLIQQQKAPNSLDLARTFQNLGNVANAKGAFVEAEQCYGQALDILREKAPNSWQMADTLHNSAKNYLEVERPDQALRLFGKSIDALEAQVGSLGGSQMVKMGFLDQNQRYYREYLSLLVEQQEFGHAYEVLERSRARVLRDMIAERDLVLVGEFIPQGLDTERRRLTYVIERIQTDLISDPENGEALLAKLQGLLQQYEEVKRQICTLSPKLASLRYPKALNLASTLDMLDTGTLLLSYAVMEDRTVLFLVRKNTRLRVITIPVGEPYLREATRRWSHLVTDRKIGKIGQKIFDKIGFELSRLLIEPVRSEIEQAKRLIIIPDGPLWGLPFGALPTSKKSASWCYLIEQKPIATAVSASLYVELKARPRRKVTKIVAMGDAVYPGEKKPSATGRFSSPTPEKNGAEHRVRSAIGRMPIKGLHRIPHTALEVQSITDLYGTAVRTYLREEANETNFKRIGQDVGIIHVAAHGWVDKDRPLDSALLLTINEGFREGEENGIVFAWEIIERARFNADLIVLSACESGLGKTLGAEGLIGLTHAFQFAGARSIIAASWNVEDQSTSVLMARFYRYLKGGKPKSEALRQAQIDMIRQPIQVKKPFFFGLFERMVERDFSRPFYWAAFQLIGPWD